MTGRHVAWLSRLAVTAVALGAVLVVGFADYATGYEISFAVFYLVPAGAAAWFAGRHAGILCAAASSVVWYVAERGAGYPYSHAGIPLWNAFTRLVFFIVVALLLSALRDRLLAERRLARTDPLTGALNSRAFSEQLEHDMAVAARLNSQLALVYIDLDDFKHINDTQGHHEGDRLLRSFVGVLRAGTRRTDTIVRLGGDEFAVILPGTGTQGLETLLSSLKRSLSGLDFGDGTRIKCSIGAVVFNEPAADAAAAIDAADRLMYLAKGQGKDRAVIGIYRSTGIDILASEQDTPAAGAG